MFEKITEKFEKCILHRGLWIHIYRSIFLMGLRKTAKRWGFSLLAQDSPIAAQNSLSWFFPAGNLDGDSVPHSHGTHKILDFGYLAPHECVRSRTPTAYRELLCNYKIQEDYAMARPKKDESLHRGKRVYIRFTELEYELVAGYAKDAGYPIGTFVRKQALREKLEVNYNIVADLGEIQNLTVQAAGIGNNLNQIARFFHGGGLASRGILEELKKCIAEIRELRQDIVQLGGAYRGNSKAHRK